MEKFIQKYIGIKPKDGFGEGGNLGEIWEHQGDGVYKCRTREFTLSQVEINHDVAFGYLQLLENKVSHGSVA